MKFLKVKIVCAASFVVFFSQASVFAATDASMPVSTPHVPSTYMTSTGQDSPNFFVSGPSPSQFAASAGKLSGKKLSAGNIDPTSQSTIFGYTPQSGAGDYVISIVFFTQASSCENNSQTQGKLINPTAYYAPKNPASFTASLASQSWYLSGSSLYNAAKKYLTQGSLPDISQVQCVKLYDGFQSVAGDAVPVTCNNSTQTCVRTTTGTVSMLKVYSNTASHP